MEQFKKDKSEDGQIEGQEGTQNFFQRYRSWILIVGAIVLIVVLSLIKVSPSGEEPKLTLESLNKTIATLNESFDSRLSKVESRTVWHTNQISDLVANITAIPNWTSQINSLSSRVTAEENKSTNLQDQLDEIGHNSTAYVVITEMASPNINAEVYGTGNFTVILTLYGSGMLNSTVFNFYPTVYTVGGTYLAGNTTMAVCLDSVWEDGDEIKIAVSGCVVDYASAMIGRS